MNDLIIKYFALLFDSIHFPIEVINEEGKIVYVNQAFIFQWGYNVNELKEYSIFNDTEIKNSGVLNQINSVFENKNFVFTENFADSLLKNKEITIPLFRTKIFHIADNKAELCGAFS